MNFEANYRDLQSKMSFKDGKNGGKKGLKNQININAVFLPFVSRNPERAKFKMVSREYLVNLQDWS